MSSTGSLNGLASLITDPQNTDLSEFYNSADRGQDSRRAKGGRVALIDCPDCGKGFSDQDKACPQLWPSLVSVDYTFGKSAQSYLLPICRLSGVVVASRIQ